MKGSINFIGEDYQFSRRGGLRNHTYVVLSNDRSAVVTGSVSFVDIPIFLLGLEEFFADKIFDLKTLFQSNSLALKNVEVQS
jgi:hypothetical protein